MKTKTKIRKLPISPLIDILLHMEAAGIEFIDIEVKHVTEHLDKIKIIALENVFSAQENVLPTKFDENRINDIIA